MRLHRTIVSYRWVICVCVLILFSLTLAHVPALAVAVPYTLTGTIDGSDPVFDNNKVLLDCTDVWFGTNWHYEIRTITVDKSIALNIFDLHNTDAMNVMYGVYDVTTTPFNASNLPLTSQCIGAATNNLNVSLVPGRNYALVIANFASAAGGNYEVRLNSTDTSVNLIIGDPGGSAPTPATITSITSTAVDGNYGPGATISIQVNFSKPVAYSSIGSYMTLALNNGASATCTYCHAYPTALSSTYTFTYNVGFGQSTADLDVASTAALSLEGGTLQDAGGTTADITLPVGAAAGSLSSNKNLAIVTPSLSINNATVTEGNAGPVTATFTITMSVALTAPTVTVNYATVNGTATAGTDYVATNGTLTFAPGTTTQTVTVTVNGDTLNEANETFRVALSGATNASVATANGTGTITDDDPPPGLSIGNTTVTEGNAGTVDATFTVTLSVVSGQTVTVNYATANGTATAGADYTAISGTITFTAGTTTQNVVVAVNGDTLNEISETFTVTLSGATNATINTATGTGTITDDDPVPGMSIGNTAVAEGNVGTTSAIFTVTLSAASGQTVTVNYATADGTAMAGTDYVASSGTLTFDPGVITQTINVTVNGDALNESDETLTTTLSGATNATIAIATGMGTITNDDPAPSLSINDATVTEGNAGTVNATFTVTLSAASEQTVTVVYATADGTATAGTDYTAVSGTVTFTPGTTTQNVTVTVNGDTLNEANETFTVALSGATNATIATVTGTGTITNDDPASSLSIYDATVTEGNAGTVNATFTVTLSAASGQTVTVDYATTDGTATAGADYIAASGTLTFNPGVTTQTINVTVNGDILDEVNETFTVALSGATNATIATATGTGTITDDDAAPSLSIDNVAVTEGNSGTVNATFTVTLSTVSGQTVTVDYATVNDTATAGVDYTAVSGKLTFMPGITTQTISVDVVGDVVFETDEIFTVTLSAATNATIATATGTGTITNDDMMPSISINDVSAAEGNTGTSSAVFTLLLSAPSSQIITVDVSTANGTAIAADDYLALTSTVTFAPGSVSETVSITINGDALYELDETYFINLTNAVNATITDNQGLGTITNDDAIPSLSVNDVSLMEGNAGTSVMTFTVTLSGASSQTVTVNYATTDGTATAGSDYAAGSGNLTFIPGVTTQTLSVTVNGDTVFEADETFTLDLNTPVNAVINDGQGVGTITNDDGQPTFSINNATQLEGDAGTNIFTFTVTRTGNTDNTDTVDYATSDGTALAADNDYVPMTGTLTFAPGVTTQAIDVVVNGDVIAEGDETFSVDLSNASAPAAVADGQGIGTILNDEPLPGLNIDDLTVSETDGGSQFTITLSPANSVAVSVDYTITDGTAREGADYTVAALTGTLNFTPGDTVLTIPFTLIDNAIADGSRAFTITLSNSSSVAIVKSIGVATILDNESPVIELPAPPPATACNDVNFEQGGAIRSNFTNSADTAALHCRLIAVDGEYMTWYGSPLTSNGNIGESIVLNLGVIAAVDIFSMNGSTGFVGDVNICLKGSGYIIYLNANGAPRVPQLWSSWTTPAFSGYTCTTLYAPGTVVLVQRQP